jgi:hypothetical protein
VKSESWIILELILFLAAFGGLSFYQTPIYEKGAWMVMGAIWTALSTILGYKFGKNMPDQSTDAKPGQTSQVQSTISNTPEPADEPKP